MFFKSCIASSNTGVPMYYSHAYRRVNGFYEPGRRLRSAEKPGGMTSTLEEYY
jgi:hypothetical protein